MSKSNRLMNIIYDIICIIDLIFLPDFLLDKLGIYESMYQYKMECEVENKVGIRNTPS